MRDRGRIRGVRLCRRDARHRLQGGPKTGAACGRRLHGPPIDPARDARYHPGRRDRPRGQGDRDTGVFRARGARPPLPPGIRDRSRDAPLARLDDDGPLSRRARRPRERPLPFRRPPGPGRAASPGRLSHGGLRLRVHAGPPIRARARIRRLRRRAAGGAGRTRAPGRRRTGSSLLCSRSRGSRSSSGSTTTTRTLPTLLPSPSAAATRATRTWARSRRWTSNSGALSQAFEQQAARARPPS